MIYLLAIISIIFLSVLIYLIYRNSYLKTELRFLNNLSVGNKSELEKLNEEKIRYIQKVEQLSEQLKHKDSLIQEFEKLRAESKRANKEALFDLGKELSTQLIDTHRQESNELRKISEENIKKASTKFNTEFERIVNMVGALSKEVSQSKNIVDVIKNSLLSPSGAGNLAEITLENILKSSGLRNNLDFIMQYSISTEENMILRPDAVIFLPNNKLMVVDAKASKFLVDDQNDLKNLAKTMNTHLNSLASKNYAEMVKESLDKKKQDIGNIITLMFVPSEHAIEKIIESDSNFMDKAWQRNILPVGPTGLMNMLSFAKFQISEQMIIKNHMQIIEEVQKLISSVTTMSEHSLRLGNSISNVVNHYDKFAASFNRNFLSKAKSITKMGIDTGLKKEYTSLPRFQILTSKSGLIDVDPANSFEQKTENLKKLKN